MTAHLIKQLRGIFVVSLSEILGGTKISPPAKTNTLQTILQIRHLEGAFQGIF